MRSALARGLLAAAALLSPYAQHPDLQDALGDAEGHQRPLRLGRARGWQSRLPSIKQGMCVAWPRCRRALTRWCFAPACAAAGSACFNHQA